MVCAAVIHTNIPLPRPHSYMCSSQSVGVLPMAHISIPSVPPT